MTTPLQRRSTSRPRMDLACEPLLMYDNAVRAPRELNNLAQWFGERFYEAQ